MFRSVPTITGALLLAAIAVSAPAFASHYDLVDIDFVTAEERDILGKQKISSTDQIIERLGKKAGRAQLASSTKISPERLLELARICDLLRIEGFGPRMVQLFGAGGITTVAQLKGQDAAALHAKLTQINDERHIAGLVPPQDLIKAWITKAKSLPALLEE
jgi:predicted flap endonuclease-1-like 5' DNA nuclease